MARYKNKLSEYQLNSLNLIFNEDMRKSLMSILSYMMIVNEYKNNQYDEYQLEFLKKNLNELRISFGALHKLYIKKHKKMSLRTLKNRIEKLIELKLLVVVDKVNNTNVYGFILEKPPVVTNNSPIILPEINESEASETDIQAPSEPLEGINNGITTNYLDSNSNSDELNYEGHIAAERKVCDWSIVCSKVNELFKALRVRSSWIKEQVISKLSKYYHTISAKYLENYITKMITNARQQYYSNWETKVRNNTKSTAPKLRFNNFDSRTYDYTTLENKLLGWDTDASSTYLLNGYT